MNFSIFRSFILIILVVGFISCASDTSKPDNLNKSESVIDESRIAKIKVTKEGKIFLQDKQVSLPELKSFLAELKQKNGTVWYYRENPREEPSAEAMSVGEALKEAELPIRLSNKPDYSDVIDEKGKSNPGR